MLALPLLAVGLVMKLVAVLFVACCIILILVILIQKGRGGGLSAAFGGGGAGGLLGTKTGDFLTWVTIVLVSVFLLLAITMAKFYRPQVSDYGARTQPPQQQPVTDQQSPPSTGQRPAPGDSNTTAAPAGDRLGGTEPSAAGN